MLMKTVFILTDFSSAADNAAAFGFELASFTGADIVLFHAYTVPVSIPESYIVIEPAAIRKAAEQQLLDLVRQLRKTDLQPVEIIAAEGDFPEIAWKHALQYESVVLVSGMKHKEGWMERVAGTTILQLAKNLKSPLLVVPEEVKYKPFEEIVFAVDADISNETESLDILRKMAHRYHASINIVRMLKDKEPVPVMYAASHFINSCEKASFQFVTGDNASVAIETFCNARNASLLVLMPHHHGFLERLFAKSTTSSILFHSHLPLLLLPEK